MTDRTGADDLAQAQAIREALVALGVDVDAIARRDPPLGNALAAGIWFACVTAG